MVEAPRYFKNFSEFEVLQSHKFHLLKEPINKAHDLKSAVEKVVELSAPHRVTASAILGHLRTFGEGASWAKGVNRVSAIEVSNVLHSPKLSLSVEIEKKDRGPTYYFWTE